MVRTTVGIEGMACGMCEAHINDTIRAKFRVKKVTSSRRKKETVILSENAPDEAALREAIAAIGYTVISFTVAPDAKKGFFASLFGK